MYNEIKGEMTMANEIPQRTPEELIQVFMEEGRDGLVKVFCVFEKQPKLNNIMVEMVDCHEMLFNGTIQITKYLDEMQSLNKRFYDEICDLALDEFSDGNITGGHLTECLDELQKKKAKCDEAEK
jgi:hypothetical protein